MVKLNIGGIIFGVCFTFIGVFLFYKTSYKTIINSYASKNWPTIEATVVTSSVNSTAGEDNNMYSLAFEAEYYIENSQYSSNGPYLENGGSSSWAGDRYEFVKKHPKGSIITLYYDPNKPYISTMKPGLQPPYWEMIFFSSLFFFAGLLTVLSLIRRYSIQNKGKKKTEQSKSNFV